GSPMMLPGGVGIINLNATSVDKDILGRMLAKPSGFYVNLHTSTNPGGAIRAQMIRLVETASNTVAMSSAQEVLPQGAPALPTAGRPAQLPAPPVHNPATAAIVGGTVTFTIQFDTPAGSVITGLHIHREVAGKNGAVEINTGLGPTNTVTTATGKGT